MEGDTDLSSGNPPPTHYIAHTLRIFIPTLFGLPSWTTASYPSHTPLSSEKNPHAAPPHPEKTATGQLGLVCGKADVSMG